MKSLQTFFRSALAGMLVLLAALTALDAAAHTSSNASLLRTEAQDLAEVFEWQASWRDLDALLDLDADADGALTWAEAQGARERLLALAQRSFEWRAGGAGPCAMDWQLAGSEHRGGLGYARFEGRPRCEGGARVSEVAYHFLEHVDPTHRLLVADSERGPLVLGPGGRVAGQALGRDSSLATKAGEPQPDASQEFSAAAFLREGAAHILRGPDHVAFVLTLVLPVALVLSGPGRRLALRRLFIVITAFTLAHSITLAIASLHLWTPPAQIVEPAIAASIAVAALHNLLSRSAPASVVIAFGFGLLHGFGFAEVLSPLQLAAGQLAVALGLFNLGVELGQLLIVGLALLGLTMLTRWRTMPRKVHDAGSAAFASLGLYWFLERVL